MPQSRPSLRISLVAACLAAAASLVAARSVQAAYPLTPDSMPQPGVPTGEVLHFSFEKSRIFPGTTREYSVYVPAQYKPDQPACLFVNQDGMGWHASTVFDNLINKKEMPVTIGVFVTPGIVRAADNKKALDLFNRSLEYDGLGDAYARFLIDELLPDVEMKKTSDGRPIHFSHDAKDRAIGGGSSGAVCAFTAAWERPDSFSRVFSAIGTYVGLRGADIYPTIIRKYETRPIRVFLQDGSADQNIYGGDWWMANQMMERALVFAGNEVEHAWGTDGHSGEQGNAVFPDAMRWLWKGWPDSVKTGPSGNAFLKEILTPGQTWQAASVGYDSTGGLAVNAGGQLFFNEQPSGKTHRMELDGTVGVILPNAKHVSGQAIGPDGRLYTVTSEGKVVSYDAEGKSKILAAGVRGGDVAVAHNGNVYVTQPHPSGAEGSRVWLIRSSGEKKEVDSGLLSASGVTLSPDQSLLYVADGPTHWVYAYQIQPDGMLRDKQLYFRLHVPDTAENSDIGGMCVDRDGRLYVATNMGIQVCDQAGRVNCILPTPSGMVTSLCFGGENSGTLFAACGHAVYKRRLAIQGAHAWDAPSKPAAPHL